MMNSIQMKMKQQVIFCLKSRIFKKGNINHHGNKMVIKVFLPLRIIIIMIKEIILKGVETISFR